MNTPPPLRGWHLDKRVPIALIFAIAIQTAFGFWWASAIDARVETLEREQRETEVILREDQDALAEIAAELAGVARSIDATNTNLRRVERQLDTLINRLSEQNGR